MRRRLFSRLAVSRRPAAPGGRPAGSLPIMSHFSRIYKIVVDVPPADHARELAFWRGASGRPLEELTRHPEYHGSELHGQDFALPFCVLPDPPGTLTENNAQRWD